MPRTLLAVTAALLLAGTASAQTPPPTPPAPGTQTQQGQQRQVRPPQGQAQQGQVRQGQQQRTQRRDGQPPRQGQQAGQQQRQGQQPPRQGGLNLDLGGPAVRQPQVQQRPGDAFSASGPYATQQQMQRFTGRRGPAIQQQQNIPFNPFGGNQNPNPLDVGTAAR